MKKTYILFICSIILSQDVFIRFEQYLNHSLARSQASNKISSTNSVFFDDDNTQKITKDQNKNYTDTILGINLEMVFIKGGTYTMGSPPNEIDRYDNETQRVVSVDDFYIGKYEITVSQFRAFIVDAGYKTDAEKVGYCYVLKKESFEKEKIYGLNWKYDTQGNIQTQSKFNHPVIYVSWNDAKAYCDWLSIKTGKAYRLPTAAEWEYACRAGTTTPFNTGKDLKTSQANFFSGSGHPTGGYREETMPVGSFAPNAWGLYDMHGNVSEWCSECYNSYTSGLETDRNGVTSGCRGGNASSYKKWCRSAFNGISTPNNPGYAMGFRVVCQ